MSPPVHHSPVAASTSTPKSRWPRGPRPSLRCHPVADHIGMRWGVGPKASEPGVSSSHGETEKRQGAAGERRAVDASEASESSGLVAVGPPTSGARGPTCHWRVPLSRAPAPSSSTRPPTRVLRFSGMFALRMRIYLPFGCASG
ncbi:hypothetical protein BS78_03G279300 [Paspalum vaginatum]|nr:hypothetical protein BS78_03G279300 [Paspalum vaginatum]